MIPEPPFDPVRQALYERMVEGNVPLSSPRDCRCTCDRCVYGQNIPKLRGARRAA